jgi:hypothetical protein
MYLACRHIKPGGEQCKSPALKGHAFCYYHARLHSTTKLGVTDDVTLPIPEDSRAIQESLGRLFQGILTSRIDSKKAAQLLWGLQIASNNLPRKPRPDPKSVPSVTRNKDGVELAPVLNVCDPITECSRCKDAKTCDRFFDFDALAGLKKKDEVGDDEDKPKRPTWELDAKGEVVCKNSEGEIIDPAPYLQSEIDAVKQLDEDEDDEDDDDDDGMDRKDVLESLRFSQQMKKTLELEE